MQSTPRDWWNSSSNIFEPATRTDISHALRMKMHCRKAAINLTCSRRHGVLNICFLLSSEALGPGEKEHRRITQHIAAPERKHKRCCCEHVTAASVCSNHLCAAVTIVASALQHQGHVPHAPMTSRRSSTFTTPSPVASTANGSTSIVPTIPKWQCGRQ